ncbi:MAG: ATP-dependent RecD-like DNA helicase [Kiritimatiellia bacterium]
MKPSVKSPDRKPGNRPVSDSEPEELTGAIENIIFRSEETGYTVCAVRPAGGRDTVTVVGNCAAVWVGETIKALGRWVRHPRHGNQFQAASITCVVPSSAKGIERYLSSGIIKGIGKVNAKRLVQAFGDDTIRIIEKESRRLEEVEGIGPHRRQLIKNSWDEQKSVRDIMIFLQSHEIGTSQASRIYRQYGTQAIAIITENPYRLCEDVWGVGFKTADSVALSVGIPPQSVVRARAGVAYVLRTLADEGHCYSPEPELLLQAQALLDIPVEVLSEALSRELARGTLVKEDGKIYLTALHTAEENVARGLSALLATPAGFKTIDAVKAVPWAEKKMRLKFAPMQAEALKMALSARISIITGGPGVGKTTIIKALADVFTARKLEVHMAAPTGRAAKRMEEATGHRAGTIHRLLKFLPNVHRFEHGPDNPLTGHVFILDEVSMIDIHLMNHFIGALPRHACLIMVGDVDQLPSVGPGNVLRDLIGSDRIPCTRLERIFRQESRGWIVQNAHRVNRGEKLVLPETGEDSDFYFVRVRDPEQAIQRVLELAAKRIPARFGFEPKKDVQVLTPMRKNRLGADNLNEILQEELNPAGPEVSRFGRKYRKDDRVMQIRNNYDKEVFNGDVGIIAKVDPEDQTITVDYDGRLIEYGSSDIDELVHAYASTIHKSQGSEYPAVVLLVTTQHFKLLQRNLLYTAITRGRKLVCLVGSYKAVGMAIANNKIRMRRTNLRERLLNHTREQARG